MPAVVLAAALIVHSAGGHSGKTEQDAPQAAAVSQTPTRSGTATLAATQMASGTPALTQAPTQPAPVQPTPQIVVVEVTPPPPPEPPPPPPEPPPPPPPTPVISGDEAKALAFDWLVQQGAEWGAGLVLPKDTLGIWWGTVRVNTNACSTIWGSGRWAVSCEFHVCNMFGCDQGVIHMWVYEATLTVTWAEPATTWGQP